MIEVLFGESEAGSMKAAKSTVITAKIDGPTAVWTVGKRKPPKRELGEWIQGTSEEVICLGFLLDVGDIREPADGEYRRKLLFSMYAGDAWGMDSQDKEELGKLGEVYAGELGRLKDFLEAGETVRIWYSDAPYSLCGLYWLSGILVNYKNPIRAVKLPGYRVTGNQVISYQNWGEVAAEEFAWFLRYERELPPEELRLYRTMWNELKEENGPLRAVINGRLVSVQEDFYDFLIEKMLPEKPVKEARLIGDLLGHYPLSVGDWWYAKRIDAWIRQGRIRVVQDSERKYNRMLCREGGQQ